MARKVFYSFYYAEDGVRASQVRNMGVIDGNAPVNDNDWEQVKKGGDAAIERWIANQMRGRSCAVVLVGAHTASRKWVKYEIKEAWEKGMGVCGIRIHKLKNFEGQQSNSGANPFSDFNIKGTPFDSIAPLYDPFYSDSKMVYAHIKDNLADWVEQAVAIRNRY